MPQGATLLIFMTATLALNVTPGPDMLYVVARASSEGRRAGLIGAFGIAGGILLHIAALAAGLATVLATQPVAYNAVRVAGALYLCWLGVKNIRHRADEVGPAPVSAAARGKIFIQGVFTSALNPKIALFFLAFLPQFVDSAKGHVVGQIVFLGVLFVISGTTVNLVVAFSIASIGNWLQLRHASARRRALTFVRQATGVLFIAIGVRIAFASR
jgi:threonine/homoserine/homoserine lactone efflux protein